MYVSGIVIGLTILGTTGYYIFYKDGTSVENIAIQPQSLLASTELRPITLNVVSASSIIDAFTALQSERGTTEMVLLHSTSGGGIEAVSPSLIAAALELNLAPDFSQTISAIRIGYINQAPYLLIRVKDSAAAMGGLLLWEPEMSKSLAPLLSLSTENTTSFLDATISGKDVRVLKNTNGAERLLYGMVGGTILITTNSASYAQLITVLK